MSGGSFSTCFAISCLKSICRVPLPSRMHFRNALSTRLAAKRWCSYALSAYSLRPWRGVVAGQVGDLPHGPPRHPSLSLPAPHRHRDFIFREGHDLVQNGRFPRLRECRPGALRDIDGHVLSQRQHFQLETLPEYFIAEPLEPNLPIRAVVEVVIQQAAPGVDPAASPAY